jgi:uncharacterized membrane protein
MIHPRIERLQRNIQICRPAIEVFSTLAHIQRVPEFVRAIASVACSDDLSLWTAQIEGRRYEWDVEIMQVIPGQMIAWRSCSSPPHRGRISLFSAANGTILLFDMEYMPASPLMARLHETPRNLVANVVEAALRDFKVAVESQHMRWRSVVNEEESRVIEFFQATGTYGNPHPRPPEAGGDPET